MRQWLVRPDLMCDAHRSGEHLETHMFRGSMHGNKNLKGFYDNWLFFGPQFLLYRHNELEEFFGGHKSPMTEISIAEAIGPLPGIKYSRESYPDVLITVEMVKASRMTLLSRCGTCRMLHLSEKREGRPYKYRVPARFAARNHNLDSTASVATGGTE